jgi:hypothetical protein
MGRDKNRIEARGPRLEVKSSRKKIGARRTGEGEKGA